MIVWFVSTCLSTTVSRIACPALAIFLAMGAAISVARSDQPSQCSLFDTYVLANTWAPTLCRRYPDDNNCASIETLDHWVLHGLWPNGSRIGSYPSNCKGPKFDEEAVIDLAPEMRAEWPNIAYDPKGRQSKAGDHLTNEAFWGHEWDKHGTCALLCDDAITSQRDYILLMLELNRTYDIGEAMRRGGIAPDDDWTISAQSIVDALETSFGVKPRISCYTDPGNDIAYLLDAWLCLEPGSDNLIDCEASTKADWFACPEDLVFPETWNP